MATNTGHVMNLANSIIGVSLLAMPFCFKQCGITLAIVMLILSSIISRLACYFLIKSSSMCRRRNFEFLAYYTFGPSGKLLVELGVIGFMMGTCVAFFVVMGDLGPAIISKIFNITNSNTLRSSVLIGLGILVVLPLGLLRNVESLAAISTATIGFYVLFIMKVFFESSSQLYTGDWWYHVNFWQPEGVLQCIPIFAMALSCQTQLFEIYDSLPSPSLDKINGVVHSALNLCTIVYTCVGLLGYIAYCKGTFTGNILLSFTPSLSSEMFKLGFVMSIAVSFPLVIFPCRASLYSLIFRRMPIHHELSQTSSHIPDSRFKCLTIVIVVVALMTGLLIPSIELVLGFVGSTIGIAICVIFPSLSFLNLTNKNTNERLTAKITLFIGLVIMVVGTCGNLFAAVENKNVEVPSVKFLESKNLPQLKVPLRIDISTEASKKYSKDVFLIKPIPPEELLPVKPHEVIKPEPAKDLFENQRKEPPIPVAPVDKSKVNQVVNPPIIQIKEPEKEAIRDSPKKLVKPHQPDSVPETKLNEVINKDAIEKEEREIMEVEKQKKTEEEEKQQELLKILQKHQDEQKKLLREQQKILNEMKNRESEKKKNEVLNDKPHQKDTDVLIENVKTIKPEEFKENLKEIQNVIDDLKDTKNIIEKEKKSVVEVKVNNISNEIPKVKREKEIIPSPLDPLPSRKLKEEKNETLLKNFLPPAPLPLAKLQLNTESKKVEPAKKDPLKSKQEVLSRDILVDKSETGSDRQKREAEITNMEISIEVLEENCEKSDKHQSDGLEFKPKNKTDQINGEIIKKENSEEFPTDKKPSDLIKNSELLTVGTTDQKKPVVESANLVSELFSQPLISKKRDLKSIDN